MACPGRGTERNFWRFTFQRIRGFKLKCSSLHSVVSIWAEMSTLRKDFLFFSFSRLSRVLLQEHYTGGNWSDYLAAGVVNIFIMPAGLHSKLVNTIFGFSGFVTSVDYTNCIQLIAVEIQISFGQAFGNSNERIASLWTYFPNSLDGKTCLEGKVRSKKERERGLKPPRRHYCRPGPGWCFERKWRGNKKKGLIVFRLLTPASPSG